MKKVWVVVYMLVSFVVGNNEKVYAEEGWKESYKEFLEMMEQEEERNIEDTVSGVIYSYLILTLADSGRSVREKGKTLEKGYFQSVRTLMSVF